MTEEQVIQALRIAVRRAGGNAAWAKLHNMSDSQVSRVLKGRRPPSQPILNALNIGRVQVVKYERLK